MINHKFNLVGLKPCDSFLGCKSCWFQYEKGVAAVLTCPQCSGTISLFTVENSDVDEHGREPIASIYAATVSSVMESNDYQFIINQWKKAIVDIIEAAGPDDNDYIVEACQRFIMACSEWDVSKTPMPGLFPDIDIPSFDVHKVKVVK